MFGMYSLPASVQAEPLPVQTCGGRHLLVPKATFRPDFFPPTYMLNPHTDFV